MDKNNNIASNFNSKYEDIKKKVKNQYYPSDKKFINETESEYVPLSKYNNENISKYNDEYNTINDILENDMDNINTKLIMNAQKKFNKNYKNIQDKNSSILNKDSLIYSAINDNKNNDKMIGILVNIFVYVLLILLLFFLEKWSIVSSKISLGICVVGFIALVVNILNKYVKKNDSYISEITKQTGIALEKAFAKNLLPNDVTKEYTCPSQCTKDIEPESESSPSDIPPVESKRIYTKSDSSRDVWKYGNIPDTTWTTKYDPHPYKSPTNIPILRNTFSEELNSEPKPWVSGKGVKSDGGVYYDCIWNGDDKNEYMPYKKAYNKTTIPCNNYPNFITKNTYICNKNNNNELKCEKI